MGLAGAAFTTGKLVNVTDAYEDGRFNRAIDLQSGYRTKTVLAYPIKNSRDEVIAIIQLINKLNGLKFSAIDEELVAAFSAQIAVSIENVLAIEEMNKAQTAADEQKQRADAARRPGSLASEASRVLRVCADAGQAHVI